MSFPAKKGNDLFLGKARFIAKPADVVAENFGIPDFLFIVHLILSPSGDISSNRNLVQQRDLVFVQTVPEDLKK